VISGTPVITGLYTMLIPTALFPVFGSSRHPWRSRCAITGVRPPAQPPPGSSISSSPPQ